MTKPQLKEQNNKMTRYTLMALWGLLITSRLVMIWFNDAEFTDAYILFSWTFERGDKWHPLYPLLLQFVAKFTDPILAGRIVSISSAVLGLVFLNRLTEKRYGTHAAVIACLLYVISPLHVAFSARVLTESLFVTVCLSAIFFFFRLLEEKGSWSFCWLTFFCGLCALTRPEGILSLLLMISGGYHLVSRRLWKPLFLSLPGAAPWLLYLFWSFIRATGANYGSVFLYSLTSLTPERFLIHLMSYLESYPYVVIYPIFFFAIYHLAIKAPKQNHVWVIMVISVQLLWLGIISIHAWWTTRFLIFPATFLLIEAAAMLNFLRAKIPRPGWTALFCFTVLLSLSLAVSSFYFQRKTYSDFKSTALFIKKNRKGQRVYSDESFKVPYYLGSPVLPYFREAQFQPGDIVTLHSFHTPLRKEMDALSRLYKLAFVYSEKSETMPVLANGLLERAEDNNRPSILLERFRIQRFESVVLQILSKK